MTDIVWQDPPPPKGNRAPHKHDELRAALRENRERYVGDES